MTDGSATGFLADFNDPDVVTVGVGQIATARHPRYLMTPALGSCVGLALYDPTLRQGGLAHIMLPVPTESAAKGQQDRFASVAVAALVTALLESGSPRRRLHAKLAGGAAMFRTESGAPNVGDRNVAEVKRQLELLKIPLVAEDTGEHHARTVELRLDTGVFVVRSYLYGVKRL